MMLKPQEIRLTWIICFFVIHSNLSCSNEEPSLTTNESRLISVGTWKIVTLKVGTNEISLDACFLDNDYHFASSKEYTMDEGPSKCDQADPQTIKGQWSLNSDQSGLVITVDGTTKITTIDELSGTALRIHYDIGPLRYEETYHPK